MTTPPWGVITPEHESWLHLWPLVEQEDAPKMLYYRGNLGALVGPRIAIVGSRSATQYGASVAVDLACKLSEEGITVVSGGAYGIDIAAHRGALAVRKPTIVVLAYGIDRVYPAGHAAAFDSILEYGGLLLSEYEPHDTPRRDRFLARNRIVAGISHGTVLVEAAERSGSMDTVRHTERYDLPLMAVPGPVTSTLSEAPHQLIKSKRAALVTSAQDVLNYTQLSQEHIG